MPKPHALLVLLFVSPSLFATEALVDSVWLMANREAKDLFLLDIRQPEIYNRFHIPGAVNASYGLWRTGKNSREPGMLPAMKRMEEIVGKLGIGNESTVVIIAAGNQASDMAASSRVFWTLKAMGHLKVAILNGGMTDYVSHFARDLESIPRYGKVTTYKAALDDSIIADANSVQIALRGGVQLLDARTLGEYVGVTTAKPNERPGTLPGAKHLPFDWLVDAHGLVRDRAAVIALFKYAGLDPNRDGTIHFCHTGNRAALTWFVDFAILGNRNAKLYDASISEWAANKELPMEAKIEF